MKTRSRFVLERRFRQWANGKTLAVLSAATLLGVALGSGPADALLIDSNLCYGGYGGPTVSVFINDKLASPTPPPADAVTGIVDLTGSYTAGDTTFMIESATDNFLPRAYVSAGTGVSLLVVSDLFVTYATPDVGPPATLRLEVDSANALGRDCPGGTHTFAATMDGSLPDNGSVTMAAAASISDRETTIIVNRTPGDQSDGSSLAAPSAATQVFFGGGYADSIAEDTACGSRNVEGANFDCTFRLHNTIEFTSMNPGDTHISTGSFKAGALEAAVEDLGGVSGASVVFGSLGVPFERFIAAVATQPSRHSFEVGALVRLGPNTDGIDPVHERFTLRVGGFTIDLPAGSFVERRILFKKVYVFEDIAAHVKAVITPLFGRWVSLLFVGASEDVTAGKTVMDVMIGSDHGGGPVKVFEIPRR